ncbi:MAG: ATP-binding protein [Chitinispirillales bacterium]|jgi:hypothetical protein|nr:ATP-binding protein [Chitinispirillales bacterium]
MDKKIPTPLPIGESIFDRLIESGSYYVDKTLFIKDILDSNAKFLLCTRPRRFGKTLNQTMLKCFFEDTAQIGGKNTRVLFNGMNIEKAGEKYLEHQGKYPVIFLSFKDAKKETFEDSFGILKYTIAEELRRHSYIKEKITNKNELELFDKIDSGEGTVNDYSVSFKFLCKHLENYYNRPPIVLIDEYDVPLENAYVRGYYERMVDFIRSLLSMGLKDNPHLQFAVITGCLRISKESIFTGLNNLEIVSILSKDYAEHFGFTQSEMDTTLSHYGMESKSAIVKKWYDGYLFGDTEVYNPWSSICVVKSWLTDINELPKPYWANTSGNVIVRKLIDKASGETKTELETLMLDGTISKVIHEDITYAEIENDTDNIWNFLFFTGYLKKVAERSDENGILTLDLSIPNTELMYIYKTKIQEWFKLRVRQKDFGPLYDAILKGNAEFVQNELSALLLDTISYLNSQEDFYHGFMLGILASLQNFSAKSNREMGIGRSDIILRHNSKRGQAVILEFKWTDDIRKITAKCEDALRQIEEKQYGRELENEGYEAKKILKYGIAFCGKDCEVRKG